MRVSIFSACVFALSASALPQDAVVTPSSKTEAVTETSTGTSTATGTTTADVEKCFYLSSKDQGQDGWLYVGLTSGGFRTAISSSQTAFNLTDGRLFTQSNRVSVGYTKDTYSSSPYPAVDFMYFTSDFSKDTLTCRLQDNQLRCDSVVQANRTRSDLVYCSWKHGNTTPRFFAFNSGDIPSDCKAASLGVVPCDEST